MRSCRVAGISGDGIGNEVIPVGVKVLEAIAEVHGGFRFNFEWLDRSCQYYVQHGKMIPDDRLQVLRGFGAIYLQSDTGRHVRDAVATLTAGAVPNA